MGLALATAVGPLSAGSRWEPVRHYLTEVTPESASARNDRHVAMALRRLGPAVIVRRGATAFAPENSFEACADAMDYGADGCEIDLRRTRDGVLILFDDDSLERLTRGFGPVRLVSYRELACLRPQVRNGEPVFGLPPTFAAIIDLARERGMLLHLDLKEPGLEDEVTRLLDAADAWDHVVHVTPAHADRLRRDPRLQFLRYKSPRLHQGRLDLDPKSIRAALAAPGHMLLVDDPRVAVSVLGRPRGQSQHYTRTLRLRAELPLGTNYVQDGLYLPVAHTRFLAVQPWADSSAGLLSRLKTLSTSDPRSQPGPDPAPLIERAWIAEELGWRRDRSRTVTAALLALVLSPTPHSDGAYRALDARVAARALGRLGATHAAPVLIRTYRSRSPLVSEPAGSEEDVSSSLNGQADAFTIEALGGMPCRAAKRFLLRYVAEEPSVRAGVMDQTDEATVALLRQKLDWSGIARLLQSPNPAVRGTALLVCLDEYTEERGLALRTTLPWVLDLPQVPRPPIPARPQQGTASRR